ncbi:MAG: GNAT family N-acetyltransferase [Nocardioidaceae bacterium]
MSEQAATPLQAGRVMRRAVPGDVAAVVEVQREGAVAALSHVFPQDTHPFPVDEVRRRWAVEVVDPALRCYVVSHVDEGVLGFAAIRGDELLHFGTALRTWGTGLAVEFHDALLGAFDASRTPRVWLRVFEDNVRARQFYEKLGWRRTGERSRTSFPPHPTLVHYERDLEERWAASGD